ncbi:hypothetical protein DFH07DRAFT_897500 [Mycena maculata]|uniref:BTB domain-containing protein n=1 Tax=Mycena maculata TaxID=230809 RepID=A0AAD7HM42_9AGAR|nr:hypothetical protein DFH07DRAFT_897500 [Mycena maculata]
MPEIVTTPTIQDAQRPFSGKELASHWGPRTDMILRSSDLVDFHCHRTLLAFGSEAFRDMVDVATPQGEGCEFKDRKAVVPVSESARILHSLLLRLYPATSTDTFQLVHPADLDEIDALFAAADKYNMPQVQEFTMDVLLNSPLIPMDSLRFFLWGLTQDNSALMGKAAYYTLDNVPPQIPALIDPPSVYAECLALLPEFHAHRGGHIAYSVELMGQSLNDSMLGQPDFYPEYLTHDNRTGQDFVWWDWSNDGHADGCGTTWGIQDQSGTEVWPAPWFQKHISRVAQCFRAIPGGLTGREARNVAPADKAAIEACPACARRAEEDLAQFSFQLAAFVDENNMKATNLCWV